MTDSQKKLEQVRDLISQGNYSQAQTITESVIQSDPANTDALHFLGSIYLGTQKNEEALKHYLNILQNNPNDAIAWRTLGAMQFSIYNDRDGAINSLSKALGLDPYDGLSYHYLACISQAMHQYRDSLELFEKALSFVENNPEVHASYALSLVNERSFFQAKEQIIKALKIDPNHTIAVHYFLQIEDVLPLDGDEEAFIQSVLTQNKANPQMSDMIHFVEAKKREQKGDYDSALQILEKINTEKLFNRADKFFLTGDIKRKTKNYDAAFEAYAQANKIAQELTASQFQPRQFQQSFADKNKAVDNFSAHVIELAKSVPQPDYKPPVFLTGFPRSGTTLTGRILNAHPLIQTHDERPGMDILPLHLYQQHKVNLWIEYDKVTNDHVGFMHGVYDQLQDQVPSKNKDLLFIDKQPMNEANALLIHLLFPQAKILRITRHPLDAVLSAFMQNFRINNNTAEYTDLQRTAEMYKINHETWTKNKATLPLECLEFKYENLVTHFDQEIGNIIKFLGLEWHDDLRKFHEAKSDLKGAQTLTPSRTQVNKALYQDSQNRWKHFEKHLEPVIPMLEPIIKELGYSLD